MNTNDKRKQREKKFLNSMRAMIWVKALPLDGTDACILRKDIYGNKIHWYEYNKQSAAGWKIKYIVPESKGGTGEYHNLMPVHWSKG
jgi:hypothetical protein